jgi:hypothetical protein
MFLHEFKPWLSLLWFIRSGVGCDEQIIEDGMHCVASISGDGDSLISHYGGHCAQGRQIDRQMERDGESHFFLSVDTKALYE